MEQLNRLTRSLRRARTVELPDGEPNRGFGGWRPRAGVAGAGLGPRRGWVGKLTES